MLEYLKSGSWILPAGAVFLTCVGVAWGLAALTGQSDATQSTWAGYGCAAGAVVAVVSFFVLRPSTKE